MFRGDDDDDDDGFFFFFSIDNPLVPPLKPVVIVDSLACTIVSIGFIQLEQERVVSDFADILKLASQLLNISSWLFNSQRRASRMSPKPIF